MESLGLPLHEACKGAANLLYLICLFWLRPGHASTLKVALVFVVQTTLHKFSVYVAYLQANNDLGLFKTCLCYRKQRFLEMGILGIFNDKTDDYDGFFR